MKKIVSLLLALAMVLGCAAALADNIKMDKLTFQFVPSKDADVIITGTKNLPDLIKAEMANLGYDIGDVEISVGTSYEATGEAMSAGTIDVGWLPGGTYAIYSQNKEVDVILTATRAGLSNDSENPADWNGEANKTLPTENQVTFYRSLIYAAPSEKGKALAAKVNAGESLTWEGEEPRFDWETPVTVTGMNAPNADMALELFTMKRFAGGYLDNDRLVPTFPESALNAVELWNVEGSDERYYPDSIVFTVEENEKIAEYEGDFLTYAPGAILAFLNGNTPLNDDTWNEFVTECDNLGINEIIAVYQNAYDEYIAGER